MPAKTSKCELKFLVAAIRRPAGWTSGVGTPMHVTMRPVYVWDGRDNRYSKGDLMSPSYSDWADDAHSWSHLAGLEIHAQAESGTESARWYGADATFEGRRITGKQALSMAKVLAKVEKALAAYRESYGYEIGVHVMASIVARACGATSSQPFVRHLSPGENDFMGNGKRDMSVDSLGEYLADVLAGKREVKMSSY